jgi:hypothetical protein
VASLPLLHLYLVVFFLLVTMTLSARYVCLFVVKYVTDSCRYGMLLVEKRLALSLATTIVCPVLVSATMV